MKRKTLGILVCMLMITSVLPIATMAENEEHPFEIEDGVLMTALMEPPMCGVMEPL